jgi:hypothetical protein
MIVNIPENIKDITIKQLMDFDNSDKTDNDYIRCFCGVEKPELISKKEYTDLVSHLKEVLQSEVNFERTFKHNDVSFGFIPNLNKIPGAEFIDLEDYISTKEYHKVVSIFFRPIIKQKRNWFKRGASDLYDIKAYTGTEQWSNEMLDVSCVYYLGAMVFFYNLSNDLLNYLRDYSVKIMEQLETKKSNSSTQSGVGTLA